MLFDIIELGSSVGIAGVKCTIFNCSCDGTYTCTCYKTLCDVYIPVIPIIPECTCDNGATYCTDYDCECH